MIDVSKYEEDETGWYYTYLTDDFGRMPNPYDLNGGGIMVGRYRTNKVYILRKTKDVLREIEINKILKEK